MTIDRVMLLIDADNISVDVMEQAVKLLLNQHGALHVRRAYCTAESAVKHQAIFKHLGIKPMVNLAAGKNSTDIALAVDAVDLVLAERPDVVVIASSDSDFAPLVHRLREKGCVVRGIGQQGKVGDETQGVYDDFTVLEHRKGEAEGSAAPKRPARKTTTRKTAAKTAPAKKVAAKKTPAAKKSAARAAAPVAEAAPPAALPEAPAAAPPAELAAAKPARKTRARKSAASAVEAVAETSAAPAVEAPSPAPAPESPSGLAAVLACLPELAAGQAIALNVAVQRLREARLLGKNSSSLRFFAQFGDRFELGPVDKPTRVRFRA